MSAMDEIRKKSVLEMDDIEYCINQTFVLNVFNEDNAIEAAEKYAALCKENEVMYAAILEASELGSNAAGRCKVELLRIARNDALKGETK